MGLFNLSKSQEIADLQAKIDLATNDSAAHASALAERDVKLAVLQSEVTALTGQLTTAKASITRMSADLNSIHAAVARAAADEDMEDDEDKEDDTEEEKAKKAARRAKKAKAAEDDEDEDEEDKTAKTLATVNTLSSKASVEKQVRTEVTNRLAAAGTDPIKRAPASDRESASLSRKEFSKLSARAQSDFCKAGGKITN